MRVLNSANRTVLVTRGHSPRPRWIYGTLALSATMVLWMAVFGRWLDRTDRLTSVASLGGHHVLVMILSGVAGAALAVLAPLTGGYTMFSRQQAAVAAVACVVSLMAAIGVLSFLLATFVGLLMLRLALGPVGGRSGRR